MYPNQKTWVNKEVRLLLKARTNTVRSGDAQTYSTSRDDLKRGIKKAKHSYNPKNTLSALTHNICGWAFRPCLTTNPAIPHRQPRICPSSMSQMTSMLVLLMTTKKKKPYPLMTAFQDVCFEHVQSSLQGSSQTSLTCRLPRQMCQRASRPSSLCQC